MTPAFKFPLVVVVWDDANTGPDDAVNPDAMDGFHKPTEVTTIGWLLRADDLGLTICNEHYDNTFRGRTFIPKQMIKTLTPYKLAKAKQPKQTKGDVSVTVELSQSNIVSSNQ